MPKEKISGMCYDVEISWGRDDQAVQVASIMHPPHTSTSPTDLPELVNREWARWEGSQGLYATLASRAQVNRMIRTLRTARDQAFGRDE